MKIEIDTKRDSKDEIKKLIKMLQHLIEDTVYFNSTQSQELSSSEMPGLGFLGDDSISMNQEKNEEEKSVDFDSLETF